MRVKESGSASHVIQDVYEVGHHHVRYDFLKPEFIVMTIKLGEIQSEKGENFARGHFVINYA